MNDLGNGYDRAGKYKFRIDLSNEKSKRCSAWKLQFGNDLWEGKPGCDQQKFG